MVAVFTHSSICPSLLRPQSVFSGPGATLRAESFCKQREREGSVTARTSQIFQGLTGQQPRQLGEDTASLPVTSGTRQNTQPFFRGPPQKQPSSYKPG